MYITVTGIMMHTIQFCCFWFDINNKIDIDSQEISNFKIVSSLSNQNLHMTRQYLTKFFVHMRHCDRKSIRILSKVISKYTKLEIRNSVRHNTLLKNGHNEIISKCFKIQMFKTKSSTILYTNVICDCNTCILLKLTPHKFHQMEFDSWTFFVCVCELW